MQSQPPTSTTTSLQKNPWPDPWSAPEEIAHDNEGGNLHNVANEGKDWDFLQASSGRSHEHSLFSSPHHQHHQQQQQRYLNRRSSLPLQQSPFTESHHLFAQPQQLIQQPSIESQPPPKIAPFAPSHIHSHHPQPSPGLYHMTAPPGQQQQYQQQQQQQLDQHFPMHQQQQVQQQQQQQQHRRDFHSVKRAPPVDMIEIDSKVQIIVELPGLKRENLKIDIHDKSHFLTLKGRYERDEYGEDVNFLMNERTHGKFRRRIRLPQHADIDHVQANMKDGLLTIEMPSLRKNDNFMKKKRVINVEGLYHQQQQQQQLEEPSTYSKARRFEWTDQDRSQVQTSADTTVHHHVK